MKEKISSIRKELLKEAHKGSLNLSEDRINLILGRYALLYRKCALQDRQYSNSFDSRYPSDYFENRFRLLGQRELLEDIGLRTNARLIALELEEELTS